MYIIYNLVTSPNGYDFLGWFSNTCWASKDAELEEVRGPPLFFDQIKGCSPCVHPRSDPHHHPPYHHR